MKPREVADALRPDGVVDVVKEGRYLVALVPAETTQAGCDAVLARLEQTVPRGPIAVTTQAATLLAEPGSLATFPASFYETLSEARRDPQHPSRQWRGVTGIACGRSSDDPRLATRLIINVDARFDAAEAGSLLDWARSVVPTGAAIEIWRTPVFMTFAASKDRPAEASPPVKRAKPAVAATVLPSERPADTVFHGVWELVEATSREGSLRTDDLEPSVLGLSDLEELSAAVRWERRKTNLKAKPGFVSRLTIEPDGTFVHEEVDNPKLDRFSPREGYVVGPSTLWTGVWRVASDDEAPAHLVLLEVGTDCLYFDRLRWDAGTSSLERRSFLVWDGLYVSELVTRYAPEGSRARGPRAKGPPRRPARSERT